MTAPSDAGQHVEMFFTDQDGVLEIDLNGPHSGLATTLLEAADQDDVDEAARVIEAGMGPHVRIRRRRPAGFDGED